MVNHGASFRAAQVIGIIGSSWLGGNIAALSLISVPALSRSMTQDYAPSSILAKQWRHTFNAGKFQNPPIAVAVATSFVYLAWSVRSGGQLLGNSTAKMYTAAAILTLGIIPFTIITMTPTNNKLLAKAATLTPEGAVECATTDDKEVGDLFKNWIFLNGIRGLLPLAGSTLALVAALA